jgi:hypothetical protein
MYFQPSALTMPLTKLYQASLSHVPNGATSSLSTTKRNVSEAT